MKYRIVSKEEQSILIVGEHTDSRLMIREQVEYTPETGTGLMITLPARMEMHDLGNGKYIVSPMDDEDIQRAMGLIVDEAINASVQSSVQDTRLAGEDIFDR